MTTIQSDKFKSNGHYSSAAVIGNTMYISGQLPVLDGKVIGNSLKEQVFFVLERIESILRQVGRDKTSIAFCTVYVSDISLWPQIDRCYAEFFSDHKPARVVVPCKELHFGASLEITAIAEVNT